MHFSQSPSRTAPRVILNMHRIHIDRVEAWEGVCEEEECVRREGGESGMRARTGGSPGGVKTQFEKRGRATETTETPSPG